MHFSLRSRPLIAAGYFDVGETAGTSILHFYDPVYRKFSLGKYLILLTIDSLRATGHELYYPGYLVAGDNKMDYKLFLGKEIAQYFDPASGTWKVFDEKILNREALSFHEELELLVAFGGHGGG